ncbi:unnamed protein product, partial [Discosporangium mesarthrocarpum]
PHRWSFLSRVREPLAREFVPSETAITQLMEMGFGREHVLEALRSTESNRVEVAMEYLVTHPPPPPATPSPAPAPATGPVTAPTGPSAQQPDPGPSIPLAPGLEEATPIHDLAAMTRSLADRAGSLADRAATFAASLGVGTSTPTASGPTSAMGAA